jgi:hypothetical protein
LATYHTHELPATAFQNRALRRSTLCFAFIKEETSFRRFVSRDHAQSDLWYRPRVAPGHAMPAGNKSHVIALVTCCHGFASKIGVTTDPAV